MSRTDLPYGAPPPVSVHVRATQSPRGSLAGGLSASALPMRSPVLTAVCCYQKTPPAKPPKHIAKSSLKK
eukprot:809646-Rhodomonas_salina.1